MSEAVTTQESTERAERPVLRRTFQAEFDVDGRTAHVRIVPFGEIARVADPPLFEPYEEEWLPGVFDHQLNAANRVLANFEHEPGIGGIVGHGIELRREADGYHGAFRVHETNDGEKTLVLLREKVLPGVSLEAIPVKTIRTAAGVVQRVKANLKAIAFCRTPAFAGSQVLALREEIEEEIVIDANLLPLNVDRDLIDRCKRIGMALPESWQAVLDQEQLERERAEAAEAERVRRAAEAAEEAARAAQPKKINIVRDEQGRAIRYEEVRQ